MKSASLSQNWWPYRKQMELLGLEFCFWKLGALRPLGKVHQKVSRPTSGTEYPESWQRSKGIKAKLKIEEAMASGSVALVKFEPWSFCKFKHCSSASHTKFC